MNTQFTRLAGIAAIIGGIALFVAMFLSALFDRDITETLWRTILPVAPLLLAVGAAGLWLMAGEQLAGRLGAAVALAGGLIMAVGLGLMGWFDNEYGWEIMAIGMLVIPAGLFIFGLGTWRARLLPRWNGLPLLIALLVVVGMAWETVEDLRGIPWQQQSDLGSFLWVVGVGLGWTLLGVAMLGVRAAEPQQPRLA